MCFRWAVFVENKDMICLFCLCLGFGALCVARELAGPLSKISDSVSLVVFFVLGRESCVDS